MHNLRLTNPDEPFGFDLFDQLLHAENEDQVEEILQDHGLLTFDETDPNWKPLGDMENNFGGVGNQQSDPTAALVEKVINSIDAVLMARFYEEGLDLESDNVPRSMNQAVEMFFGVPEGAIERLSASEQTKLADNIHMIATGTAEQPCYLIVDRGEGQTPQQFPDTFLSLYRSNKMRIPFVQGKFNSGGTGVLQFCGERNRNYQLIVSRRNPHCPAADNDDTREFWGYTLVRRLPPNNSRRSSVYVYLAPNGRVPLFKSPAIYVLSERRSDKKPDRPYSQPLEFGTCVKLYNYRWRAKSLLTTDGRYELERLLHRSCLPFRVSETRQKYSGNYFSATVTGGWNRAMSGTESDESAKLEQGFPAWGEINLPEIGKLPYQIIVFKTGTNPRRVPNGVVFVVNGQVYGAMPSDYVSRKLKFDYLKGDGPLLVSVDCTNMEPVKREDFFMSSRDRVRKNESYDAIESALTEELRAHKGLQELNQLRRKEEMEKHQNETPLEAFQEVINKDPSLAALFGGGERLVTGTGPSKNPEPFQGRLFPSYFRISHLPKGGLEKHCPVNRTVRVEFETDAVNDYFDRLENPGSISISPPDLLEASHLWNGHYEARLRVPWDAKVGDRIRVDFSVSDIERDAIDQPFLSTLTLIAEDAVDNEPTSGTPKGPRERKDNSGSRHPTLALPEMRYVRKPDWGDEFDKYTAIGIKSNPEGGYDFTINLDCAFLLTELNGSREDDKPKLTMWFAIGLVLAAISMIRHEERLASDETLAEGNGYVEGRDHNEGGPDLTEVARFCNGLAQVIIPIVRSLNNASTTAFEATLA